MIVYVCSKFYLDGEKNAQAFIFKKIKVLRM